MRGVVECFPRVARRVGLRYGFGPSASDAERRGKPRFGHARLAGVADPQYYSTGRHYPTTEMR